MIEIYFDGACEPFNPGGTASYGYAIKQDDRVLKQEGGIIGEGDGMTNNVAEYSALIKGVEAFRAMGLLEKEVKVFGDSKMVTAMASKAWGWNKKKTQWIPHKDEPQLKALLDKALALLDGFSYTVGWVPREQNQLADAESKKALVAVGAIPADKAEDEMCPRCKTHRLRMKHGPHEDFWGCSDYPNCKYAEPVKK